MARQFAQMNDSHTNRVRVRTPGKHILLFLFLPVVIVAAASGLWLQYQEDKVRLAAVEFRRAQDGSAAVYFTLPEMLVDLAEDKDGHATYLKLKASILLKQGDTKKTARVLSDKTPQISERLTFLLRILRPEDLEGSTALESLKEEMKRRINLVIAPAQIDTVIIENMIVQ